MGPWNPGYACFIRSPTRASVAHLVRATFATGVALIGCCVAAHYARVVNCPFAFPVFRLTLKTKQKIGMLAMNKWVSGLLLYMLATTAAIADKKTLTAAEIKELLTGNTAVGTWIDHEYRQYFGTDGSTIYAQKNTRSSVGRWRTNSARNHYESWWERIEWGAGYHGARSAVGI